MQSLRHLSANVKIGNPKGCLAVLLKPIHHHLAEVCEGDLVRFQLRILTQCGVDCLKPLVSLEDVCAARQIS